MPNDLFEFKKFSLKQDRCAMKVGTDAVLIGSWVNTDKADSILDIGTGTGIIALMLAQRCEAAITALEIDQNSFEQATENVKQSPFSKTVSVLNVSFQHFSSVSDKKFDLIVTNPPYFVDSLKSNDSYRSIARHADALPFQDLVNGVVKCLSDRGRFCLILPKKEAGIFKSMAEQKGLYLTGLLKIKSNPDKDEEIRQIMQFEFNQRPVVENSICIRNNSGKDYSDEYRSLTADYHLSF